MATVKHETGWFNDGQRVIRPGTPFDVDDDTALYLNEHYGFSILSAQEQKPKSEPQPEPEPQPELEMTEEMEVPIAVYRGKGWYELEGKKVRKSKLPANVQIVSE